MPKSLKMSFLQHIFLLKTRSYQFINKYEYHTYDSNNSFNVYTMQECRCKTIQQNCTGRHAPYSSFETPFEKIHKQLSLQTGQTVRVGEVLSPLAGGGGAGSCGSGSEGSSWVTSLVSSGLRSHMATVGADTAVWWGWDKEAKDEVWS